MMKRKPRVAVFFGGSDDTRDLSLETGRWVSEYFPRSQYDVIPVSVAPDQKWQVPLGSLPTTGSVPRAMEMLAAAVPALPTAQALPRLLSREPDAVFTVVRGKGGDDGAISALAQAVGVAAVGSSPLTCAITADKQACMRALESLTLSPFAVPVSHATPAAEAAQGLYEDLTFPLFVKPTVAEGSTGITRVEFPSELPGAIAAAQTQGDVLVQEMQQGTEITVTVYENEAGTIVALPPTQVQPLKATFFDSLAKRREGRVKLITMDRQDPLAHRAMQLAQDVYQLLACRGVVTVDMIAHGDDIDVLEVNTVPTATAHTPLAAQLKAAGLHPTQFVDSVVQRALAVGA